MTNYEKTSKKTVNVTDTYHLTDEVKYTISFVDGKETERKLKYTSNKINGYDIKAIYKEDISILEKMNPYLENFIWLSGDKLPNIEDIDISNVILTQPATYSFFTSNKEPIPVHHKGIYTNAYYDLEALKKHLEQHPNVTSVSEINSIRNNNNNKYIEVGVYPTSVCLQIANLLYKTSKDVVFGVYWDNDAYDFLNIKQFLLPEQEC